MAAAGFVFDLLHRTGEVEIDDIVLPLVEDRSCAGHGVGLGADDLAGDWMILIVDVDGLAQALAATEHDGVEQGFGDGIGTTAPAGDNPHGAVGIAGEACLAEGLGKGDRSDRRHGGIIALSVQLSAVRQRPRGFIWLEGES